MVSIVLNKEEINLKGEYPIYFQINKSDIISSGVFINAKYWDYNLQKIKSTCENSEINNLIILTIYQKIKDKLDEFKTKKIKYSFQKFKKELFLKHSISFFYLCNLMIENYHHKGKNKSRNFEYAIKRLKDYIGQEDILLGNFDYQYVENYERYLRVNKNYSSGTIQFDFRFLGSVFKYAISTKLIKENENPFLNYKVKTTIFERDYLTIEEIEKLKNVKINFGTLKEKARDLFLFSYYCGGIRISDLLFLKKKILTVVTYFFALEKLKSNIRLK